MAHDLTGFVEHGHNARRMDQRDTRDQIAALGQKGPQLRLIAMGQKMYIGMGIGANEKAGNHGARPLITAHTVD